MVVERAPLKVNEEQPLLKVDTGGGDGIVGQPPSAVLSPGWSISNAPKRSWINRWPEVVTACWMTGILLGMCFLVLYVLTMGTIMKHSVVIVKCNNSRPGSEVYFHHIVQRGCPVPIDLYSEYLSDVAVNYPSLYFNVIFLTDDSSQNNIYRGSRHLKIFNRLIPHHFKKDQHVYDEATTMKISDFEKKFLNVNITTMPLSKYMALTPLRYKWRGIPISYLTFYARIFSVWQTGGVGIDLTTFNDKFNNHHIDRRISAILKQHNDGIEFDKYAKALNIIERDEENEFFSVFYDLVKRMLNETRDLFIKPFSLTQFPMEKDSKETLVRTHRNKREVVIEQAINNTMYNSTKQLGAIKLALVNTTEVNTTSDAYRTPAAVESNNATNAINKTYSEVKVHAFDNTINLNKEYNSYNVGGNDNVSEFVNVSEVPKFVMIYDFSFLSDLDSSFVIPKAFVDESMITTETRKMMKSSKPTYILSIDTIGSFVAASSRFHPFLGHIISAGCQRMSPTFAIEDALLNQCGGLFKDDVYCNNIYVL